MRKTRRGRRAAALGSAGVLVTATLIAGAVSVPAASAAPAAGAPYADPSGRSADHRGGNGNGHGGNGNGRDGGREARGVAVAAARAARAGVDWKDCPADWNLPRPIQCGWVTVPVDYARPDGRTIRLAVDRVGNTGTAAERQGALVYNPGGPGASGMRFPTRVTNRNAIWAKAAKAYDFVGFDPRGVGRSAPVSCVDPQVFAAGPKADPVPSSEADKRLQRRLAREYAEGCGERAGALLPYLTTPNSARDLDVIRAALGESGLNYLGVSYGTYLGSVYATLFPGHVRRMVVDSVVNPSREKIWYQANLDQDVAFEKRWKDWQDWVAANDAVYHLGTTRAQVQAQWLALRATAERAPIGGVVGPAELIGFFQSAPYYDSGWAPVASVLSRYAAGDTRAVVDAAAPDPADTAGNIASENSNAVYTAVECADAKWPTDWRTWDRDNTRLHRDNPFITWANAWMNLPCATWPGPQRTPVDVRTGKGLPPVLIVQSERDAATPYPGAVELHQRLRGSRLITERNAGSHGVTGLLNPCVNDRVDAYLLTGGLDARDVTCDPHATPRP
ncbi:alpha/beta hydrolase [Streptomyces sp. SHP 1-2]|uniref:alpha/beta hydrolase n=1 Tax=Streptomyces sp. SHP 1-2 TaxID=2769489 RepID=UPI0022384E00|nr:alpha/beta hydrolase [Streptomyces sp. SHP 1-2]MCW5251109.1 alpha/beta fold hydrolase [Streptomyces sp. SHP 1-2]